jgi:hypothetical protein
MKSFIIYTTDITLKRMSCVYYVVHEVGKRVFQMAAVYFIGNTFVEDCTTIFHCDLMLRKSVLILTLSRKEWCYTGTISSNIKVCLQILMQDLHRLTLFFFFRWRYSPLWVLACRTIPSYLSLSITNSLHLLTPNT